MSPKGSRFEGLAPREKPIVFYGTSITHGACASRPGMVHTAILGRWLDMPVVNLGFSGNGRMDQAVGEFLVQVDATAYVIDCLPNMGPERCDGQVRSAGQTNPRRQTRHTHRACRRPAIYKRLDPTGKAQFHTENHAALRSAYESLLKEGVTGLLLHHGRYALRR